MNSSNEIKPIITHKLVKCSSLISDLADLLISNLSETEGAIKPLRIVFTVSELGGVTEYVVLRDCNINLCKYPDKCEFK